MNALIDAVVDELTYRSYEWNRRYAPHISAARWVSVYGPSVWAMERRLEEVGAPVVGTSTPGSSITSGDAK
ncbi:MAG: hypothetical protein VW405_07325 [Rhodospirillaceae bacterium]